MTLKEKLEAIKADLIKVAQKSERSYTIDQKSAFDIIDRTLVALIEGDDEENQEGQQTEE